MNIGVPREVQPGETRVALTPHVIPLLLKDGHTVLVESGAGNAARFADAAYHDAGAQVVPDVATLYERADAVFRISPLARNLRTGRDDATLLHEGTICLGLLVPLAHLDVMEILARRRITSYALDYLPRISRAQYMDALTSMATVAGYKAVLLAADRLDKLCPLLMTAAGTISPATVLVLGAGVAGLQAIATAKRLGARVEAFDPRPAVREQVQSLGAAFLEMELSSDAETAGGYARIQTETFLQRERDTIAERLPGADIVICTAQVFGKPAPLLITADMVRLMHRGAVIVDMAAEPGSTHGGNCELTQPDAEIARDGVYILGATNLPAQVPFDASQLYARNLVNLFRYLYPATGAPPGADDEIVRGTCVTRDGEIVHPAVRAAIAERAASAPIVVASANAAVQGGAAL